MDKKLITGKGKGYVSTRPDLVVVSLGIESENYEYEKAMDIASEKIQSLSTKVETLGIPRDHLKTESFDVNADYKTYTDRDGSYQSKFTGYVVKQKLKLEFDFDSKKLGTVLKGISETSANPKISVDFSVKDKTLLEENLLVSAAQNAKRRAEILTSSLDKKLGDLISIDYNWSELDLYSDMNLNSSGINYSTLSVPEIEPKNIEVSDNVTFIWEIK